MLNKYFRDRIEQQGNFLRLEHEPEEKMGRLRGSYNKEKPFKSALRVRLFDKQAQELREIVKALVALAIKAICRPLKKLRTALMEKLLPRPVTRTVLR
jgi:hypothetical protein